MAETSGKMSGLKSRPCMQQIPARELRNVGSRRDRPDVFIFASPYGVP
jgi:hypothetical protein